MTIEEKAKELGQKYFPDANNIWARANIEALNVERACVEMAQWQREQIMKGLCFETKVYLEDDGCAEDFNYMEWLDLENKEITELPIEALVLKDGDKVKVIIVKED